jgi:hypothetical protein
MDDGGAKLSARAWMREATREWRRVAAALQSQRRFPPPGEQLLRGDSVPPCHFGNDRVGNQRRFNRARLLVRRPAPPSASASDRLDTPAGGGFRLKLKVKSRHKPIPKSWDHTRPSDIPIEGVVGTALTTRQYARVAHSWIERAGTDGGAYGAHSMRRTKAAQIYRKTGNLRAVQLLLGHTKLESAVRYLGIEVDDALTLSEQVDI